MASAETPAEFITACGTWFVAYAATFCIARYASPLLFQSCEKQLDSAQQSFWVSHVTSTINGVVVTVLGVGAMLEMPTLWNGGDIEASSPLSFMGCHALLGYMAFDTVCIAYYHDSWPASSAFLVHHVAALCGWGAPALTGFCHDVAVPLLLCEATSPLLNLAYFMRTAGLKSNPLYAVNGAVILVAWFVLRIWLVAFIAWNRIFVHADQFWTMPQYLLVLFSIVYGLSAALQVFWFVKIAQGAFKLFFPSPKSV